MLPKGCPLVGITEITYDIGRSFEIVNHTTSIATPFLRYGELAPEYVPAYYIYGWLLSCKDRVEAGPFVDVAPAIKWISDTAGHNLPVVVQIDSGIDAHKASEKAFKRCSKSIGSLHVVTDRGLQVSDAAVFAIPATTIGQHESNIKNSLPAEMDTDAVLAKTTWWLTTANAKYKLVLLVFMLPFGSIWHYGLNGDVNNVLLMVDIILHGYVLAVQTFPPLFIRILTFEIPVLVPGILVLRKYIVGVILNSKHNLEALLNVLSLLPSRGNMPKIVQAMGSSGGQFAKDVLALVCIIDFARLMANILYFPTDSLLPGSFSLIQQWTWEWNLF